MWPRNLLHQSAPTPPPSLSGVTKKLAPAGPLMRSWRRIAGAAKSFTSGQPSEGGAAATATAAACQATGSRSTLPAAAHAAVNERPGSVESSPTASEAHAALPSPMEGQSSGGSSEASAEGGAAPAHLPCYRHTFLRLRSSGDGATVAGCKPGAAKPRGLAGSSLRGGGGGICGPGHPHRLRGAATAHAAGGRKPVHRWAGDGPDFPVVLACSRMQCVRRPFRCMLRLPKFLA